jgi:hypothetical protein
MIRKNQKHPPLNDRASPGDKMADGTIFAGLSPDTGKPMYTTPTDAPLTYTFNEARNYAARLHAHGYGDWRVPTKNELIVLFNNRAAIGGFDVSHSSSAGRYWSSTESRLHHHAWTQRFSDGNNYWNYSYNASSLRCVRG